MTTRPTPESSDVAAWRPARPGARGATTLSVSVAIIASLLAVVFCAYVFMSFAGAETTTVATRLSIGLAFALSFFSAVSVNRVLEGREPRRS